MMLLTHIASYVPEQRIELSDRADLGISPEFAEHKLGIARVSRKAPDEDTSDLCLRAFERLAARTDLSINDVDCIVVCTQNPDSSGLPHTSAVLHGKLGANTPCAAYDISLGCSGYVYGLAAITGFMRTAGLRRGLFFTADPYSKIIDPDDRDTVVLFGDAATVSLIEDTDAVEGGWLPHHFRLATMGEGGAALQNRDGTLHMKGRAVFNFSATQVPPQIEQVIEDAGMTKDDIDLFVLHQGSKYIVDTIRTRLGLPEEKVPLNLADWGNTVSSSIPMILEPVVSAGHARRILLSGFGVGLSLATCLLEKR